jgi:hypothetical protein
LNDCFCSLGQRRRRKCSRKNILGSSPNRVGGKDTRGFSAPGVCPVPGGTESAGTTRIPERILRFRKAPVPDSLRKTESQLQSGQLHHHLTRTDGRTTASLCPARDGMRPRGPSRLPPRQPTCRRRKINRIHPLDREKIHILIKADPRLCRRALRV